MHKIKIGGIYLTLSNKQAKRLHTLLTKVIAGIKEIEPEQPKPVEKPALIFVPDNIKTGVTTPTSNAGLINKGGQELYYDIDSQGWGIAKGTKQSIYNRILTPISKDRLATGDIFFASDAAMPDFSNLYGYRILLEDGSHIMWNRDNTVTIENAPYKYYWKVKPETDAKPV